MTTGLRLQVVAEPHVLPEAADLAAFAAPARASGLGLLVHAAPQAVETPAVSLHATGDAIGAPLPDWARAPHPAVFGAITLCRVPEAAVSPVYGAVIGAQGHVFRSSVTEMLSWRPDLALLPHVAQVGEDAVLTLPADLPTLEAATLWRAWGGAFNYGHFLLDCLPSLLAVEEAGLAGRFPPITAPLKPWARDLLSLALPHTPVREVRAPMLKVDEALFATSMDHFLHHPNALLARLRARILARSPEPTRRDGRVYLSRRGHPMRVMVNEAALERALRRRGFRIVRAERLSVAAQIALMRSAQVVVGPSGAALANALFTEPGARIVEIQPQTFTSQWVDMLCRVIGRRWTGYFCPAPVDPREVALAYRIRRGFGFGYRLPLADFLGLLDGVLGDLDRG